MDSHCFVYFVLVLFICNGLVVFVVVTSGSSPPFLLQTRNAAAVGAAAAAAAAAAGAGAGAGAGAV
jgi:hypothetical protein